MSSATELPPASRAAEAERQPRRDEQHPSAPRCRPLRVLQVVPQLGSGGAERYVLTLVRHLDPARCVTRLCVLGSHNQFPERIDPATVVDFLHYGGSRKDVRGQWRCVQRLRRIIRDWQADVVHSHLWPAARLASLAVRGTGAAHVVHVHDTRPWLVSRRLRAGVERFATRALLSVSRPTYIAVSESARDFNAVLLRMAPGRVHTIRNAVDVREFSPAAHTRTDSDTVRIGVIARLDPEKGHEDLWHAFAGLLRRGARAQLFVAGEGSQRGHLEQLAGELRIASAVRLMGVVSDVPQFLRSLDVCMLPSRAEGLPLTVLEAMATGLPVIATNVAGTAEAVRDGVEGLLVEPRDVAALEAAMCRLISDEPLRLRMGRAALERARSSFSIAAAAGRVWEVYRDVAYQSQQAESGRGA